MNNFELNLNFFLKDLDGKEIEKSNAGKTIAQVLAENNEGDAVKYWGWALNLNEGKPLSLDKSDKDHLKKFINDHKRFTVLLKAQAIAAFEEK